MMSHVRNIFFFAVLTAVLIFGVINLTPDLWRDIGLRNSVMVPHSTARIDKASCKGFALVLKHCTVTFHDETASLDRSVGRPSNVAPPSHTLDYLLVGSPGERRVALWRAVERPGNVTSDLGMEYLTNRILTFVGMTLFYLFILTSIVFYIVSTFARRKDDPLTTANSADEAIARHVQAGPASPAWQTTANTARPARSSATPGFGRRIAAP